MMTGACTPPVKVATPVMTSQAPSTITRIAARTRPTASSSQPVRPTTIIMTGAKLRTPVSGATAPIPIKVRTSPIRIVATAYLARVLEDSRLTSESESLVNNDSLLGSKSESPFASDAGSTHRLFLLYVAQVCQNAHPGLSAAGKAGGQQIAPGGGLPVEHFTGAKHAR